MSLHFTSFFPTPLSLAIPISQKNENGGEISGMHASRERDAHLHNVHATGWFFRGKGKGGYFPRAVFLSTLCLNSYRKGGKKKRSREAGRVLSEMTRGRVVFNLYRARRRAGGVLPFFLNIFLFLIRA
jgi:hypothetical protein